MTITWIIFSLVAAVIQATAHKGFKSVPTTVKTFENDTVLLPCYVDNTGTPARVRWWREGVLLADSGEATLLLPARIKMCENNSLEVSSVKPEDTGEYVCQASRPAPWGHVTQVHAIEVMYPPSVHPVPESGELEVAMGDEVDMACVAKGVPTPIISWRSKGEDLLLIDDRPRLRFHADNRDLSGRYTCVATNGVGQPASATIDLRVKHKPEIEVKKTWVHASPGIRAQLDCKVIAWPDAKIEWYFNDEKVPYSPRIVKHTAGNDHSLIIRNTRTSDYGYYLCRASNTLGVSDAVVELSGVANPAIFKKESHSVGKTVYNFIWEVDSYSPIIEYQFWFREFVRGGARSEWHKLLIPSGSNAIGPVHARSFNLTGLALATHYEGLILSRNRYGWSRPSRLLRFSTEGAPSEDDDELIRVEISPEQKIMPEVEIASMSQHSQRNGDASGGSLSTPKVWGFLFVLPITVSIICTLNIGPA
ncbi:limbic system-associated membrane protein-like isoform X1 [Athalia rosae]|uniref:limbic system-associated membrane protein-like isoform X1 n=2 Tax=Athalia rosae TaxID=37344 RepID=UPI0006257142|nr:limbic system-associated membrane protein-like isoform X1 [Athalia rosae]XP_048514152.1 limbic system-associated membrane protein-like isoform X1 [Athalia rosae]